MPCACEFVCVHFVTYDAIALTSQHSDRSGLQEILAFFTPKPNASTVDCYPL